MDFEIMTNLQFEYDDYVEECKDNGIEPKDFKTWWNELE